MPATPYFREAGHGPTVLCLHSNASHSGQWRGLMELLSDRFRVVAVDSYGAGKSPEWPSDSEITLADEVDLIEPLLASAPEGVHLVGHSYGAAVALKAALMHPARVLSLALYEPTIFALVDRDSPRPNATEGIQAAVREGVACLDRGDREGAARAFIDFWMGEGSFDRTPVEKRGPIVEACRNLRRWAFALMTEPATVEELRSVSVPVLCMVGGRSPESSRSVARRSGAVLPDVRTVELAGLGHMGPVTHPQPVNDAVAAFLAEVAMPKR